MRELLLPTVGRPAGELARGGVVGGATGRPLCGRARHLDGCPSSSSTGAAALTCAARATRPDPGRLVAARTWRHLREVAAFADDLAARGRALPAVLPPPVSPSAAAAWGGRAVWRPLVTGADAVRARALALALPPAGRAALSRGRRDPRTRRAALDAAAVDARPGRGCAAERRVDRPERSRPRSRPGWPRSPLPATGSSRPARARSRRWPPSWRTVAAGGRRRARAGTVPPGRAGPLVEPASSRSRPEQLWTLEFALQATAEPSLVAPAEQVWAGRAAAAALARLVPSPRAALLTELGRASRLYPELERALRAARPEALVLDTRSAHDFLREAAPVLAAAGFGVDLPGLVGPALRPARRPACAPAGAASRASSPGAGRLGQEALVDYEWEVSLGEERLDAEELARLAELQQPLVRLRGQWVELDPRRLARGLKLLEQPPSAALSARRGARARGHARRGHRRAAGARRRGRGLGRRPAVGGRRRPPRAGAGAARGSPARCARTRSAGWPGWRSSTGSGSAASSPTTWAWARPSRCSPCSRSTPRLVRDAPHRIRRVGSPDGDERAHAAGLPDVAGRQLAARGASGSRPTCASTSTTARTGPAARSSRRPSRRRPRASRPTPSPRATSRRCARCAWRRVVLDEAQAIKNAATRQAQAVRAAGRPAAHRGHRDAGGEPARRPVVASSTPATRACSARPPTFTRRFARPIERHGDEEAADRLRTLTRPFVLRRRQDGPVDHRRPARQARDGGRLLADPRAGGALQGGRRRHAREGRGERGHRAPRPRARDDDQAQAGLQPPRASAARRHAARRAGPASSPGSRRRSRRCWPTGEQGPALHPVRRVRRDAAGAPVGPVRPRGAVPARRRAEEAERDAMVDAVPAATRPRPRCSSCR